MAAKAYVGQMVQYFDGDFVVPIVPLAAVVVCVSDDGSRVNLAVFGPGMAGCVNVLQKSGVAFGRQPGPPRIPHCLPAAAERVEEEAFPP